MDAVAVTPVDPVPASAGTVLGVMASDGFRAVLVGRFESLAIELAGPEVAVRAIFAALVDSARATDVTLNRMPFQLAKGTHRMISTSLGDGQASLVLLNERVVRGAFGGTASDVEPDRGAGTRVPIVCGAGEFDADDVPHGFGAVFHALVPLPMDRAWAPFLWKLGRSQGLIDAPSGEGSLRGYRVRTDAEAWAPYMAVALRAARAAGVGPTRVAPAPSPVVPPAASAVRA